MTDLLMGERGPEAKTDEKKFSITAQHNVNELLNVTDTPYFKGIALQSINWATTTRKHTVTRQPLLLWS